MTFKCHFEDIKCRFDNIRGHIDVINGYSDDTKPLPATSSMVLMSSIGFSDINVHSVDINCVRCHSGDRNHLPEGLKCYLGSMKLRTNGDLSHQVAF